MKRTNIIKLTITLLFLVIFSFVVDLGIVKRIFLSVDIYFFILFLFLHLLTIIINSAKWYFILSKHIKTSFSKIFLINFESIFFGIFGLGTVGSDIYKFSKVKSKKLGFFSILEDKFWSVFSLLLILFSGLISLVLLEFELIIYHINQLFIIDYLLHIFMILLLIIIFLLFLLNKYKSKIKESAKNFSHFKNYKILYYSLLNHTISVFTLYLFAYATGLKDLPLSLFFVIIPLISLLGIIPISYMGFGISELVFLFSLSYYQISFEQIIAFTLIGYSVNIIYIVLSYLVYTINNSKEIKNE